MRPAPSTGCPAWGSGAAMTSTAQGRGCPEPITDYLERWDLTLDGEPFSTRSSHLAPVHWNGEPAMLKIAREDEERFGGAIMTWWNGRGAARVFRHDELGTILIERAIDGPTLFAMAEYCVAAIGSEGSESSDRAIGADGADGADDVSRWAGDDEASRILVATAHRLHAIRDTPPPTVRPLAEYFRELFATGAARGDFYARSATVAEELLANPRDTVVLHGDLHHGNVLWFGADGWLAIDPKNCFGDRGFDFANIFCNPTGAAALAPGRLERQVAVVSEASGLGRERLLRWIVAYTGLSASWHAADGDHESARMPLEIGRRAEALLG